MLWAICCYFNPAAYQTKKINYATFREHLSIPLLTIELAYHQCELAATDADHLIQIRGADVLWQKERLLNIALQALPPECTAVAWLDTDIIFEQSDWHEQTLSSLETCVFVQPFEQMCQQTQGQSLTQLHRLIPECCSVASAFCHNQLASDYFSAPAGSFHSGVTPGVAWAGRRDLLDQLSFYDAMIVGGGDRAMFNAMCGQIEPFVQMYGLSPAHAAHYRAWAAPFYQQVQGRVGYVAGRLYHLWHGQKSDRQYQKRREILPAFGFDPLRDIQHAPGEAWCWSSNKPTLHAAVANYFNTRLEDGLG